MQAIASKLVYGVKLEKQHVTDSTRIDLLKKDIVDYKEKDTYYKNAVKIYDFSIAETKRINDKTIKKLTRNITWLKVGWTATAVFLAGTTTYFLIK
jgi:hypothetical protein